MRSSRSWPVHRCRSVSRQCSATRCCSRSSSLRRRVVDNLLDNARKYSDDGTPIEILITNDGDAVRIEVVDRGIGIAAEDQERVFSAFFRADRCCLCVLGGVGLGLVLARRIVEAHDGTLAFTSELGRGSRFWLTLPKGSAGAARRPA